MKNLRVKNQENSNKKVDALQKDISENEIVFQNLISSIIPLLMIVINDPIKYKGLT